MAANTMRLGPILGYEWDTNTGVGAYTVLVAGAMNAPVWQVEGQAVVMTRAGQVGKLGVWKGRIPCVDAGGGDACLPPMVAGRDVGYQISEGKAGPLWGSRLGAKTWTFHMPGTDERPRVAYASCNGFSSAGLAATVDPGAMWQRMEEEHQKKGDDAGPFSLLLMGGDQVYCDGILALDELFTAWWALWSRKDMQKHQPTKKEKDQIAGFYGQVYLDQWGGRDPGKGVSMAQIRRSWPEAMMRMMASVPSVMMWDDHDVFDGWGSYTDSRETWPVYQAIFASAREYFALFQLRGGTDNVSLLRRGTARKAEGGDHFSFGIRFGDFLILALDNRSERTPRQMMKAEHWAEMKDWVGAEITRAAAQATAALAAGQTGVKLSLLVMTGVPVVWRKFLKLAEWVPSVGDDVRDHWGHPDHEDSRDHLVHYLFEWAAQPSVRRVTLISGDVHVGGLGVLEGRLGAHKGRQVVQVVSSAIVHPAPKGHEWVIVLAGSTPDDFEVRGQGIVGKMVRPSGSPESYLVTRNFATLKEGTDGKLWVNWVCENELHFGRPYYPIPATDMGVQQAAVMAAAVPAVIAPVSGDGN